MDIYNSKEYKRSRGAYLTQCMFEYFISLLVADAFIAKLLSSIGISDAWIGIISSFISLAFVIQLFSIALIRVKVSTKKLVIVFDAVSQLFFMLIYIVPFLPIDATQKKLVVILSILIAYIGKYLISSICFKWANSYVHPRSRASYSAVKEIVSLLGGILFTTFVGYIIDRYESMDNINGAFLFIASAMLIINFCNFICLMMIQKESPDEQKTSNKPWRDVIKNTLLNKNFRNVIILSIMWECARYFTTGFLGIYKTKDLLISVFAVQLINTGANLCRVFVSVPFGKYSDRRSFAKGFELALIFAAAAFLCIVFTNRSSWYMIIVYSVLYNISAAGTGQNSINITYSYVDIDYITQAMAFKNSIAGLCGFASSLVAGKILSVVQANGNQILGITVYGQQLLGAISFLITVIAVLFIHFVIAKQSVKVQ